MKQTQTGISKSSHRKIEHGAARLSFESHSVLASCLIKKTIEKDDMDKKKALIS